MLIKNLFKHWADQLVSPGTALREKYEAFKSLLQHDGKAHELLAELEEIYYNQLPVDLQAVQSRYQDLSREVSDIVADLARLYPAKYSDLRNYLKKFDSYVWHMLCPQPWSSAPPHVKALEELGPDDQQVAGSKSVHLAIISKKLGIAVPKGFVITANAFNYFLEYNNLIKIINRTLAKVDIYSSTSLARASGHLTDLILNATMPQEIEHAIAAVVHDLWSTDRKRLCLAMRSSAVGEDTRASFAGQYRTMLNVSAGGIDQAYRQVIASKYSPGTIYYRINYGLADSETPMAVLGLEMIDARASGVIYTRDLSNPAANRMTLHSIFGLGELLVDGQIDPDVITFSKDEPPKIIHRKVGRQSRQLVVHPEKGTEVVPLVGNDQEEYAIDHATAMALARWGIELEAFFGQPQDIEWCVDRNGQTFLLQSRLLQTGELETVVPPVCDFSQVQVQVLMSGGDTASAGIGAGKVVRIPAAGGLDTIPNGSVLVARTASPRYVQVMDRLNAVVAETGSVAGHFASVAREFGIPALVNVENALEGLPEGQEVTVYADGCKIYRGAVQDMLESPCARRNLMENSPFMRRLAGVMSFISPLRLVDPQADSFEPHGCRSLHDIIRFCHEKAVQAMFHQGDRRIRKIGGSKKLESDIPMQFYVVDVGQGLDEESMNRKTISMKEIRSVPLGALLAGLSHPGIKWGHFTHFDWAEHDRIVMSGGIISPEAAMFASHAVISRNYVNLNLKFGYHFVIVDSVCSRQSQGNYILFRFSGGGADYNKRILRADFLSEVLQRLGFELRRKSDLVDAEFPHAAQDVLVQKLDMLGRLLGATRLMDMYLKDQSMVGAFADDFMDGRYHFASVD